MRPSATIRRGTHSLGRRTTQPVISIRAGAKEPGGNASRFVKDAFQELHAFVGDHDLRPEGPPFVIVHEDAVLGDLDIEVGLPIDRPVRGSGRVHGGALPSALTGHSALPGRGAHELDPDEIL